MAELTPELTPERAEGCAGGGARKDGMTAPELIPGQAKERLLSFGYAWKDGDEQILSFSVQKVENTIKNDCGVPCVPRGLANIAVDMAVGEFLTAKKTFAPDELAGFDLGFIAKQIQTGDTCVQFAAGEGNLTDEQRLDAFLRCLLTRGRDEFSCYRRIRW